MTSVWLTNAALGLRRSCSLLGWALRGRLRRLAAFTFLAGCLVYFYPALVSPWVFPHYRYMHDRFSGVLLFDSKERLIGLLPGAMDSAGDFADGFPSEDHKAAYIAPDEVPEPWWRILRALEDRHLGSWRSWGGIDVVSLAQALAVDLPRGRFRGASTLPMMLVRSMHHAAASPNEGGLEKLGRKLREWLDAPVLMHHLGRNGMGELKQWLAMHVALAQGAPGSRLGAPIYGLKSAALLLFGRRTEELGLAEQAVLAAAFRKPILLAPDGASNGAAVRDRYWRQITARAKQGIRLAYGASPEAEAEQRRLDTMPPPVPHLAPQLTALLPGQPLQRFRVGANPASRAGYFAHGETIQLMAELMDRYGRFWRRQVSEVHLTLDIAQNFRFKREVEAALKQLERRHAEQLQLKLTGAGTAAQVVVALSDGRGLLLRYYANGEDSVYAGIAARRGPDGRYLPARETRPVGSLGKMAVAVFLGSQGDQPGQMYCNKRLVVGGSALRNPGQDTGVEDCRQSSALYPARLVFARSLNLPLLQRLHTVGDPRLAPLAAALGLTRTHGDTALWMSLPLGMLSASPRTLHGMTAKILAGVLGHTSAGLPTIIGRLRLRPPYAATQWVDAAPMQPLPQVLQAHFARDGTKRFVRDVLSAPLAPGGTAQGLANWRAGVHPKVSLHLAKTGTTPARDHQNRDAYLTGGLVLNGKPYSYLVLVGTGSPARPLSDGYGGGHNAPLVRVALSSLSTRP